jgi:hypothetical protein
VKIANLSKDYTTFRIIIVEHLCYHDGRYKLKFL